ncbi:MAG: hypothetical protein LQ343_004854 [Gyalolechia ehrenbergii]|nr:MAG: hypothetical protein LQ343_004854 [Gyalolechia ehrenbergii]
MANTSSKPITTTTADQRLQKLCSRFVLELTLNPHTQSLIHRTVFEKKYTKDHEWIELNDDKTQGITTYAASALGDVVYVELPTLDLQVSAGDSIGAVESVKSASDIMTPVGGKIVATNEVLEQKPATINKGPEGEGWIARIELEGKGEGEMEGLMGLEEYRKFVEE